KWWKIGAGILLAAGAVACILIEPCGVVMGAAFELLAPLIAPEFVGFSLATVDAGLIAGGAAVAEFEIAGSVESDLAVEEIGQADGEDAAIKRLEDGGPGCLKSFASGKHPGATAAELAAGVSKNLDI